jgi:uncharacterized protein (DUF1697 family)
LSAVGPRPSRVVALLRGINVGGKNLLPMPALVAALEDAGLRAVETYIQSGNLFIGANAPWTTPKAGSSRPRAAREPGASLADRESLEQLVEGVIEARFGLRIPTIVRSADDWRLLLAGAPFPEAQRDRPKLLHVGHAKRPLAPDVTSRLTLRATRESVVVHAGALFIDFADGAGRSKLTPAAIDQAAGSAVTLRNWNTTLEIAKRLGT